jgi:hypothetical protein
MADPITLTKAEAAAVLLLLKSITYDGLNSDDGRKFQATLMNLGERLDDEETCEAQYEMWQRIGYPAWNNSRDATMDIS